jgi:ATP-dependent DNA helicase DinG
VAGVADALSKVVRALPGGGEPRPGQVAMAEAVADAIERRRHLVVQAGTGTGKSFAYLVPALLSGRRVVVATATKALQGQLAGKDLPLVCANLGLPSGFAVLKGRSNYACRQRVKEIAGGGDAAQLGLEQEPAEEPDMPWAAAARRTGGGPDGQIRALLEWAGRSSTGDRADLDFEPSSEAWTAVSVSSRECPGPQRCPSGDGCFAEEARSAASEAQLVVVNTHLYGAHLASGGAVLPEHDVVVFDEAHTLEDVMCASLGHEVAPSRLRAIARSLPPSSRRGREASERLADAAARLDAALGPLAGSRLHAAGSASAHEVYEVLQISSARVEEAMGLLREPAPGSAGSAEGGEGARRARSLVAASQLAEDLRAVASGRPPGDVVWVDGTARSPLLRVSPVEVAPLLEPLWSTVTGILTSATVPAGLGARVGVRNSRYLDVGSPFPYETNALLYCAAHLPDRRREDRDEAAHAELARLIEAAGGRTLALFTSWRAMKAAADALRDALPFAVMTQADLPKPALLEAFSAEESACLFATMGFWQGVDVPGPTLSLVVIDRIPFPRPDDPLVQARREKAGAAAFSRVDLPRAATLLAQGAGRLIRSADDRGVVAVLDPRLARAGYRWELVRALPPMRRTRHRSDVEAFLGRAGGGGAQ